MALIQATHAYNIIYVYCADDADHQGIVKIGKATVRTEPQRFEQMVPNCEALVRAANERIHEQTGTFGASHRLLHTELAHFKSETGAELQFYDTDVHQVLLNSGYTRHHFPKLADKQPQEWFDIAPEQLDIVKRAILAVKQGRTTIDGPATAHGPVNIVFRREQLEAIEQTVAHFARPGRMLWNAKMRFGKTLCALETVRRLGSFRTLILTHRPAVKSGWFDDFRLIKFKGYSYGSKPSANTRNGQPQVGERFDVMQKQGHPFIYFASMQDLRGSWIKGGHALTKNEDVFATPWDLVIIDEAHEGTTTALGQNVIRALQKRSKRFLYLSGTPYNILDQFRAEETYTWDYINEQEAKARWDNPSKPNPYEGLARLNIRTYNLGSVFDNYNHSEEDYFEFAEFFRTWTGHEEQDGCPLPEGTPVGSFVHEKDVRAFLELLHKPSANSYYPFSREAYRAYFAHTFWVVPGVREAAALSQLLQEDRFFRDFCVVNVAGEGDRMEQLNGSDDALKLEKQERDCLSKVKQAIATHERTITLSCGRLTTGVSIEQWTAVFLLSGSYHTKAASYLQTIFRAQTPFKHTPGIKTDCYAFDFAPDRTLTVIDEYIKTQARSRRPSAHNHLPLTPQTFLKYCSVIAIDGGRTVDYDAVSFMQQVNHVYAEHVIQQGFRDSRLYTGLFSVGEADLGWIADIGRIVGEKGNGPKRANGQVVVAQGGLDGSNGAAGKHGDSAKHPQGQQPTSASLRPKRSPDEEARTTLRRVLDIVSVRLPMMIFGVVDSVETLTLAKFVDDIDANSWREFMPNGFTKGHFKRLLTFYNNDVFISSALHILSKAKEVDRLPITQRTEQMAALIATFHYPDKETVLTPWRVVNLHMASTLGGFDFFDEHHQWALSEPRFVGRGGITQQVFGTSSARVLEINSKSGVYPLWVAYTLFRMQAEKASSGALTDETQARRLWKQVVETNLFVVCQTPMAEKITRRVLVGYGTDIRPNTKCFPDLIDALRTKGKKPDNRRKLISKILKPSTYGNPDMKRLEFSVVVGNPPYQLTNKGNGNGADSLYNLFLDLGRDLATLNTMIHPARFLFNAGKTPKPWNEAFLQSRHYRVVDYWANSAEVFPRVDVKGGIAITMYNRHEEVEPIGFFSPFDELRAILKKVEKRGEASFSTIVGPRELYGLTQALYDEHPELESRTSKGHKYSLGANIFDLFPEVFLKECPKDTQEEMARIFGRHDNQRCFRWVKRAYITQPESFFTYKVVVPKANGTGGAIGEVLSTPILGEPILGHTDTFLSIGQFANESEASACMKYIKTRFARTMLGTLKRTQDNPRSTWKNVPLQDFTSHSDIDWSLSVANIDKQLYAKYGLTNEEIAFIAEKVQAME